MKFLHFLPQQSTPFSFPQILLLAVVCLWRQGRTSAACVRPDAVALGLYILSYTSLTSPAHVWQWRASCWFGVTLVHFIHALRCGRTSASGVSATTRWGGVRRIYFIPALRHWRTCASDGRPALTDVRQWHVRGGTMGWRKACIFYTRLTPLADVRQ